MIEKIKYRPEIDGLRAIAVVPVILFHAGFAAFSGGYVGVDVFFVISGYLITRIIVTEMRDDRFSLVNFYERRARRILPLLYFVIFSSAAFAFAFLSPGELMAFFRSAFAASTYWSNIFFWREINYFGGSAEFSPLLHTWSLSIEEQYYLLYPVILLVAWRLGVRATGLVLIVGGLSSFSLGQWGALNYPHAAFYLLFTRGWELLVGALVAVYETSHEPKFSQVKFAQILSAIGVLMVGVAIFALDTQTPFPSVYTLIPTLGVALILVFAVEGTAANALLRNRTLVAAGLISYGLYLWHQPILAYGRHLGMTTDTIVFIVPAGALVTGLSILTYRYVETPFRNRSLVRARTIWLSAGVSTIAILAVSSFTVMNDGFRGRYAESSQDFLADLESNGEFVPANFRKIENVAFEPEHERKILVVGDSFAMDVVNALVVGLSQEGRTGVSAHHISARCGNLYLEYSILDEIATSDWPRCQREGWYTDSTVGLMREADEIWLVSSWKDWHLEYLEESLGNMTADFSARIVLFGTKQFWDDHKTFRQILEIYESGSSVEIPDEPRNTNREIDQISRASEVEFIDVLSLMCGDGAACDLHVNSGKTMMSVDGGHLTVGGVQVLSDKLSDRLFSKE